MNTAPLPDTTYHFSTKSSRQLSLTMSQPHVMGILNVTPDSFSDGAKHSALDAALSRTERMVAEGASIIDIGGESTRPNAAPVNQQQEMDRVLPIVEAIARRFDVVLSVDTSTPKLMREAVTLGAHMWNDVRGLTRAGARELAAELDIPVMIMHMRGEPTEMMTMTQYADVVVEVKTELMQLVDAALQAGVKKNCIILDVGFGFAKTTKQNFRLLNNLDSFGKLGFVQMIGLSKKRMLADALAVQGLDSSLDARIEGGLAAALMAVSQGVSIIRTHDVLATKRMLSVYHATQNPSLFSSP